MALIGRGHSYVFAVLSFPFHLMLILISARFIKKTHTFLEMWKINVDMDMIIVLLGD